MRKDKHTGKLHIYLIYSLKAISTLVGQGKDPRQKELISLAEERKGKFGATRMAAT